MDIALDSFPNTGCTTTCEALWMGVPVITLAGQHYVSRMAAAVLAAAELEEWITESVEQYQGFYNESLTQQFSGFIDRAFKEGQKVRLENFTSN